MNMSLTSREDQVVAVSLEKTSSGKTKLWKHRRGRPCLQDLVVLGALEAAPSFGIS